MGNSQSGYFGTTQCRGLPYRAVYLCDWKRVDLLNAPSLAAETCTGDLVRQLRRPAHSSPVPGSAVEEFLKRIVASDGIRYGKIRYDKVW